MHGVIGLLFDLRPATWTICRDWSAPITDGTLRVGDVTIAATSAGGPSRQFPLRAVVLQAQSLDIVREHAPTAEETSVMGRPALRIETNPLTWDLLITA